MCCVPSRFGKCFLVSSKCSRGCFGEEVWCTRPISVFSLVLTSALEVILGRNSTGQDPLVNSISHNLLWNRCCQNSCIQQVWILLLMFRICLGVNKVRDYDVKLF